MAGELEFGPFLDLPAEARSALASSAHLVRVGRGSRVIRAGEEGDAAYAILDGRVRVIAPDGTILSTMWPPSLAGELGALSGDRRTADVVALDPLRALRIGAADLRSVASAHPGFARTLEAFADAHRASAFLRREGPFTDLSSEETEELATHLRPLRLPAGSVLMRQGEQGDAVYLIRQGLAEAVRSDTTTTRVLGRLGPGSLVGEVGALTSAPRTATVRCVTDVDALLLPGDRVRAVVKKHRHLLDRVRSVMQARHAPVRTGHHQVEPAPDDPDAVILRDPDRGMYLRLDHRALAIYEDLDGERTLRDLSLRHFERTGMLDPEAVFSTVAALQVAGLATAPRVARETPKGRVLRLADLVLAPHVEVADVDPHATRLYRALAPFFTAQGAMTAAVIGVAGLLVAAPVLRTASAADFGAGGLAVAFAALLLAAFGHEVAHALAAKAHGSRLGRAGIGLFWLTPVIYVDTSSTWSIPRWGRIRVNAAGPLFNLALAGVFGMAARLTAGAVQDVLSWLSLTNVALFLFNLSPLLEFDGYWVVSDLTDTNGLRRKAMRFVFGELARRPRPPRTRRESGFIAYVVAALLYVVAAGAVGAVGVPRFVHGVLPQGVAEPGRTIVSTAFAVVAVFFAVLPFAQEIREARASSGPRAL